MTTTPAPEAASFARSARVLCGALVWAVVLIGIVMFFVLGTDSTPPLWVPLVQIAAGVVIHLVVETIGYRLPALDPSLTDEEAATTARQRWQGSMMLRFALSEALAIASLAAAFVIDGGVWTYVGGAVVSLVLMLVHVWPGARSVTRTADALESGGQASFLREAFGLPAPGPIQQR